MTTDLLAGVCQPTPGADHPMHGPAFQARVRRAGFDFVRFNIDARRADPIEHVRRLRDAELRSGVILDYGDVGESAADRVDVYAYELFVADVRRQLEAEHLVEWIVFAEGGNEPGKKLSPPQYADYFAAFSRALEGSTIPRLVAGELVDHKSGKPRTVGPWWRRRRWHAELIEALRDRGVHPDGYEGTAFHPYRDCEPEEGGWPTREEEHRALLEMTDGKPLWPTEHGRPRAAADDVDELRGVQHVRELEIQRGKVPIVTFYAHQGPFGLWDEYLNPTPALRVLAAHLGGTV